MEFDIHSIAHVFPRLPEEAGLVFFEPLVIFALAAGTWRKAHWTWAAVMEDSPSLAAVIQAAWAIGEVRHFDRPEKLVAYIGLNPGQRQSGNGKNIKLGVGKRGRGDMRHLLIQGAQAVLRMGGNTPLGKWGW
ncbi:MAG: IS110 family transposase, partial [Terrimicrobiaceae bacterium]